MLKTIGGAVLAVGQGLARFTAEMCCYATHAMTMSVILGLTLGSLAFGTWGLMATVTSCPAQITYLTTLLPRLASVPRQATPRD